MVTRTELTTRAEAARQLRISERFLDLLIRRERIKVIRLGRAVRIPTRAIEQLARKGA